MYIHDKCLEFNNKSLELKKEIYDINHPIIATSYHNLAAIYRKMKQYDKAEKFYIKSLNIKNNSLEENHPSIAISYTNLGTLYKKWQKFPQSFKNYFLALKMRLNLELSPINLVDIENSFRDLNETKRFLKLQKTQKIAINKQIDELNKLFKDRKLKHKIAKLK
jgi:tetratricopeptide (TPR) repeat protein